MNELIGYLIQSSLSLTALYLVYLVFLRHETFFLINRIYLVITVVFSLVFPFIPVRFLQTDAISPVMVFLEPVLITPEKIESLAASNLNLTEVLGIIYIIGFILFTIRFLNQLMRLWLIVHRKGISHLDGMKLVLVDRGYSAFSFFNLIFVREEQILDEQFHAILQHEKVHIRQLHSFDLLLVEGLTVVQWFNPFVWIMQRSVKSLHEYLADEGVIRSGFQQTDYQQLVFNCAIGIQPNGLANNFNVSHIQKRLLMMTKNRSRLTARLKLLAVVPVLLFSVVYFASASTIYLTANARKQQSFQSHSHYSMTSPGLPLTGNPDSVYKIVEKMPVFAEGEKGLFDYLVSNIKYPVEAKKKGTEGVVFVTFIVEKDGSVSNVKVLRGIGSGCDEEAVRVVRQMPKWTPGYLEGKPVRVVFNLPVKYMLSKEAKPEEKK